MYKTLDPRQAMSSVHTSIQATSGSSGRSQPGSSPAVEHFGGGPTHLRPADLSGSVIIVKHNPGICQTDSAKLSAEWRERV